MDIKIIRRYLVKVNRMDVQAEDVLSAHGLVYSIRVFFFPRWIRVGHGEAVFLRKKTKEFRDIFGFRMYHVLKHGTYEELYDFVNNYLMALAIRMGNNYRNNGLSDEHGELVDLMKRFRETWHIGNVFVECPAPLTIRFMAFSSQNWQPPDSLFV